MMLIAERKSKYKHKVLFDSHTVAKHNEIQKWCLETFGPGGRKFRWRFGWTDTVDTYYFKDSQDATLFVLRWS